MELERLPLSLESLVEGVAETLAPGAHKKNLLLNVSVDPALPDGLIGDPVRLRQVLFNIAGNAVKFTESGSVSLRADLEDLTGNYATVRLTIADTGIGMDTETRERLFQPFAQASASTARRFGGTGLGLSICRRIAELMGGEIGISSVPGRGSTFWFRCGFELAPAAAALAASGPRLDGAHLLVAVGDGVRRASLARSLAAAGARVSTAATLAECEALVGALEPAAGPAALVIADCGCACENGVCHSLDELRALPALGALPVLLVSRQGRYIDAVAAGVRVVTVAQPVRRLHLLNGVLAAIGRVSGPALAEAEPVRPAVDGAAARRQGLILVAEDHPVNRQVIRRQLELIGCAAELVEDGRQALEAWRSGRFTLILTDCQMPEMDGYQLAAAIRREEGPDGPHIPIIAITASIMAEETQKCLAAGMDSCLGKPLEIAALSRELSRFLASGGGSGPCTPCAPIEPPRETPPVDRGALSALFGEDEALIGQLLREFQSCNRRIEEELRAALARADWEEVRHAAHKLAGSSRTVGAAALADLGAALEQAVLSGDIAAAGRLAERAIREVGRVSDYISRVAGA